MGETQNLRNNRVEKYDPIYGRFVRDIKTTDIINIFKKGTATSSDTITWDMVTYTTDANHALYPYIFGAHACGITSCPQIVMYGPDSTTLIAIQTDNTGQGYHIGTGCECPLTRIAPSSTITLTMHGMTSTTDTICAWVVAKREPIVSIVEN